VQHLLGERDLLSGRFVSPWGVDRAGAYGLEDPTLVILDPQSVRAATGVPAVTTDKDAATRVPDRERGITLLDQVAVAAGLGIDVEIEIEIVQRDPIDPDQEKEPGQSANGRHATPYTL
jgi:hypothetical protein